MPKMITSTLCWKIAWISPLPNWFRLILKWIEVHSTFVNILFKILCGITGIVGAGLFYYFKFYRKQKTAALFGFYIQFDMLLSVLKQQIDRVEDSTINPFILLYTDAARDLLGLSLPGGGEQETEKIYLPISDELKKLLLDADNNVYPKACEKDTWYQSQKTVLDFVFMMTDRLGRESIEIKPSDIQKDEQGAVVGPEGAKTHINKWEELKKAVESLQNTLKEVRY